MANSNLPLINSPLTNIHYINVWSAACTQAVREDPSNQAALFLKLAFNELRTLYSPTNDSEVSPLQKRNDIYDYFRLAGKTGYPRAMFFEGLALQGFGCKPDLATSDALIHVAAFARDCDLALQYLLLRLGKAHLYGNQKIVQSYPAAIKCFQRAGKLAEVELKSLNNFLNETRQRLVAQQNLVRFDQAFVLPANSRNDSMLSQRVIP